MAEESEEKVMVLTDEFEEDMPGVLVNCEQFPVPLLIPVVIAEETDQKQFLDETFYSTIKGHIDTAVEDLGEVVGQVSCIFGYPVQKRPNNVNVPMLVYYNEQYFRLYNLIAGEGEKMVICYVPYCTNLSYMDRWKHRHEQYPVTVTNPKQQVVHTSDGDFTLH